MRVPKPRLLDVFCGAGGCSVGYERAGFEVAGIDIDPHPDYPFAFVQADAMEVLQDRAFLSRFEVVHTSPPCPRYSAATNARPGLAEKHPDLVGPVRDLLRDWGGVYVIENVPGAPLDHPALICGWAMGLRHIRRHRLFESNVFLMSPGCLCPDGDTISVFGNSGEDRRRSTRAEFGMIRKHVPLKEIRELMGVQWMTKRDDISDAIPPSYTQHIGEQLIEAIRS